MRPLGWTRLDERGSCDNQHKTVHLYNSTMIALLQYQLCMLSVGNSGFMVVILALETHSLAKSWIIPAINEVGCGSYLNNKYFPNSHTATPRTNLGLGGKTTSLFACSADQCSFRSMVNIRCNICGGIFAVITSLYYSINYLSNYLRDKTKNIGTKNTMHTFTYNKITLIDKYYVKVRELNLLRKLPYSLPNSDMSKL